MNDTYRPPDRTTIAAVDTQKPQGCSDEIHRDLGTTRTLTAVTYVPRQDGGANGRVGRYEVYVSADGANWGTPVAAGTFADDAGRKTVRLWPVATRYVRLRALTEAGGRGRGRRRQR
ncbi:discoidin domain-containing protein [Actinosynnema sp. CA-248983]